MNFSRILSILLFALCFNIVAAEPPQKPNIILIMTDDQGWGQTGYYNHPVLKTPHLDAMAENGLRFDRFYAGAPVCSPTRASVLTGRANDRTGVPNHGHALRLQEKTLAIALKNAGYRTGHFGKWHLNGIKGFGVPVLGDDSHSPGAFGFDEWLTVTNFFDINPYMSRNGKFEGFKGDSSDVIVRESLKFISKAVKEKKPFLTVIWDGSPHDPFIASEADGKSFSQLDEKSQHHYGELVAFDRSLGKLRKGLRDLGVADTTLVWYCSDNGGLNVKPESVGGLRGLKGSVFEGGLRVPAIIEWPNGIIPRVTTYPASTMDIFPTIAGLLDLPESAMGNIVDGINLVPVFTGQGDHREIPIPFRFENAGALVDNQFKLVCMDRVNREYALYHLESDPKEATDVSSQFPEVFMRLKEAFEIWSQSVDRSVAGLDYPGGLDSNQPESHYWTQDERYEPYFPEFKARGYQFRGMKKK